MDEAKEPNPSFIQGEAGDAVLVGARFGFCDGARESYCTPISSGPNVGFCDGVVIPLFNSAIGVTAACTATPF